MKILFLLTKRHLKLKQGSSLNSNGAHNVIEEQQLRQNPIHSAGNHHQHGEEVLLSVASLVFFEIAGLRKNLTNYFFGNEVGWHFFQRAR